MREIIAGLVLVSVYSWGMLCLGALAEHSRAERAAVDAMMNAPHFACGECVGSWRAAHMWFDASVLPGDADGYQCFPDPRGVNP